MNNFKYKRVTFALIGEGRTHGDDDAIAMRPYTSSLKCNVPEGVVLILGRAEFQRIFKSSNASMKRAINRAKEKEMTYVGRCQEYLSINKLVIEDSKDEA